MGGCRSIVGTVNSQTVCGSADVHNGGGSPTAGELVSSSWRCCKPCERDLDAWKEIGIRRKEEETE